MFYLNKISKLVIDFDIRKKIAGLGNMIKAWRQ
jgi:hypothetical protein